MVDPIILASSIGFMIIGVLMWQFFSKKRFLDKQTKKREEKPMFAKNIQVSDDSKPLTDLSDLGFAEPDSQNNQGIKLNYQSTDFAVEEEMGADDMSIRLVGEQTNESGQIDIADETVNKESMQTDLPAASGKHNLPDVLILFLMSAEDATFQGYEMLQSFSTHSLHYSKQKVFQRYENEDGSGGVWFFVASATEPGTFNLLDLGKLSCSGIAMFLDLKNCNNPLAAFECFILTAGLLREDLGGMLCNEKQIEITDRLVEQWREGIKDLAAEAIT